MLPLTTSVVLDEIIISQLSLHDSTVYEESMIIYPKLGTGRVEGSGILNNQNTLEYISVNITITVEPR